MSIRLRLIPHLMFFLLFKPLTGQVNTAEKIYKKANHAVVRIFTYTEDNTLHGQASGVIIIQKGWIVTNFHILGTAASLYAEHEGKLIKMDSILAIDAKKDIMILQMSKQENENIFRSTPDIRIGNSDKLRVGQRIYAIGSPHGFENTITEGIISGLRSSFDSTQSFIQISAPISSGSSGGAILNSKGELIGISTLIFSGAYAQNLNFAVLINDVLAAAKKTYEKTENLSRDEYVSYYYQAGYSDFMSKNYLSAIYYYRKALEKSKSNESHILFYYTGLAFHRLGILDSAITYYEKSSRITEIADSYTNLGSIYYQRNEYEKAVQYYEKALALAPHYHEALTGLGLVYYKTGDYVTALIKLKKVVELGVRSPSAYLLMGHIAYAVSRFDDAISFYMEAISVQNNYAEAYLSLSKSYMQKGNMEKAVENQQKAYLLKPELRNQKQE